MPTVESCAAMKALVDYRQAHADYLRAIKSSEAPALVRELPLYVIELVEALEVATGTHRECVAEVARQQVVWPILATRHQPRGADFAELADRIELGAEAVVNVSPQARYRIDAPLVRLLLNLLQHGYLATAREFYFVNGSEHRPRLTRHSLPWFLDEHVMPMLDQLREAEGSWSRVPVLAELAAGVEGTGEQRRVVRRHIKAALEELAGPVGSPGTELEFAL